MKFAAYLGNRAHAPENCRLALISGYTGGCHALHLALRLSGSGRIVLAADADTEAATGTPGRVGALTVSELRQRDFSHAFRPRGVEAGDPEFHFLNPAVPGRRHLIDALDEIIDELPGDVDWVLELRGDPDDPARDATAAQVLGQLIAQRGVQRRVVFASTSAEILSALKARCPRARTAAILDGPPPPAADMLIVTAAELWRDGGWSARADEIRSLLAGGRWPGMAYLVAGGALPPGLLDAVEAADWISTVAVDSMFDVAAWRPAYVQLHETFAGQTANRARFALGYAKANPYAHVTWNDGVHVDIAPYDGDFPSRPPDPVARRLEELRWDVINIGKEWPYYSGGGLGAKLGVSGDFAAEVTYAVARVGQATTLEMAVVNVDPGAHRDAPPVTFRDKDSFFDPHGAPPFVGVEHDEDDGFRINWNLGAEYDNNQYGGPVGDGAAPRGATLRLERRGAFFAAYYRRPVDVVGGALPPRDWVCVGVSQNESLNSKVFLRCVGKRWRQEKADDPHLYEPVIPNRISFRDLSITRFPTPDGD
ncbi:glycerophosphodiester phosphodiesterase [Brevundimonas sp.]|uniref:glycerophosphodiester phosphodiesterase n=1 Tax=Brevundimonas sp. TaxID=1871086 RepID=UPI002D356AFC|nr:glycerophosphodiester phosphodiesterase family protein [Brevundimonas sp.]HYC96417.1 glycerophosphodiester phosphodiesterase family protein [Brevundimonas sp.]